MSYTHEAARELSREEMDQFLTTAAYGRLGLAFENEAYVVPVSYHYDGHAIHFHIGREGKKTTYLQANPQACFQIDESTESGWCSVICYGTVTLSDTIDSKRDFFKLSGNESPSDDQLHEMHMYVCTLAIDEVTGRRSPGYVV